MNNHHDGHDGGELNRFWNDLVSGTANYEDYDLPEAEQRMLRDVQSRASRPQPDSTRERAWRRTFSQIAQMQEGEEPMSTVSIAVPGERLATSTKVAPPLPALSERRWQFGQFAAAALLILTLGIGYLAFDRFGSDSGQRPAIPAAVQTSDDLAENPVIGIWQMVDDQNDPAGDGFAVIHPGGTYTEVDHRTTFVGIWRVTGENTIEILSISGDLSGADEPYTPGSSQYLYTLTYDPATDTLSGHYMPTLRNGQGDVVYTGTRFPVEGTRISFESNENQATPNP